MLTFSSAIVTVTQANVPIARIRARAVMTASKLVCELCACLLSSGAVYRWACVGQVKVWRRVGSTLALDEVHTLAAVNVGWSVFSACSKTFSLSVCPCTFVFLQRSLSLSLQVRYLRSARMAVLMVKCAHFARLAGQLLNGILWAS